MAIQLIAIGEVMSRDVQCVEPTASFSEVVDLMAFCDLSCVIVARDGIPLGMISERDLVRVLHESLHDKPLPQYAAEVMTAPVTTVFQNATVHETMCQTEQRQIRHLAVVDDQRHLVGVLTQTDLLRAQAWDLELARQAARRLAQGEALEDGAVLRKRL